MKRIITIFMAVLLIVALAVPAFASSYPESVDIDGKQIPLVAKDNYPYVTVLKFGSTIQVFYTPSMPIAKYDTDGTAYIYADVVGYYQATSTNSWQGTYINGKLNGAGLVDHVFKWTNYDVFDSDGQLIFTGYKAICDGSTCPANDLNADGVCDDCGMTLSLRLVGYPALPNVSGSNLESVVLQREDGYFFMALTSDSSYSVSGTVGENYLITVANEQEVSYVTYKCTDGKNWVHNSSGEAYSLSVGDSSAVLLASTFDWSKDGEHFFPVPPTLAEVTEEALGEMTTKTLGTMRTLVVCGVGLIALLVVLSLFSKRSLIFRS